MDSSSVYWLSTTCQVFLCIVDAPLYAVQSLEVVMRKEWESRKGAAEMIENKAGQLGKAHLEGATI